jgi:hypothetical protein
MKKKIVYFALLFALVLVGCSTQQDEVLKVDENQQTSTIRIRSIAEAIDIAKSAKNLLPVTSRSEANVDECNVIVICSSTKSRSGESDTLLYAVNNEESQGFTLIAAPLNVEPIIAVTENGSFNGEETVENESFQFALKSAINYISAESENPDNQNTYYPESSSDNTEEYFQQPRVKVRWSQRWPSNLYCHNQVAGCAPVAIAQICSAFEEPSKIELTFDERDKDLQELDWTDMKRHISGEQELAQIGTDDSLRIELDSVSPFNVRQKVTLNRCAASTEGHRSIGRLVRQIGVICKSVYKDVEPDSVYTSTTRGNARLALRTLLPNRYNTTATVDDSAENLYDYLESEGVALVLGCETVNGMKANGHGWVADATGYTKTLLTNSDFLEEGVDTVGSIRTTHYIHYNWGWGGNSNGYFSVKIFSTNAAKSYDTSTNTAKYNFNTDISFTYLK